MPLTSAEKNRENKIRTRADRRGYRLVKSSSRDETDITYGRYLLVPHNWTNPTPLRGGGPEAILAFERGYGLTIEEMEAAVRLPLGDMEQLNAVIKTPTGQ